MRKLFVQKLKEAMKSNPKIVLLVGDVGYGMFDDIAKEMPKQFLNCGVSEQAMISFAVGLQLEGKIPVCYSITPFLLFRPYELIRILVGYDKANVKLIASGRDNDYDDHNFTHLADNWKKVMETMPNINVLYPTIDLDVPFMTDQMFFNDGPYVLNLKR